MVETAQSRKGKSRDVIERSASSLGRLSAPPPPHTERSPSLASYDLPASSVPFLRRPASHLRRSTFFEEKRKKERRTKKCKRICQSRGQATKALRLPASSSLSCLRLALEESVDLDGSLISTLSTEAQRTVTNTQLLFVYLLHMPECRSLHRLQNNA